MSSKMLETDRHHWLKLEAADLSSLFFHQRTTYEKHVYISAQLCLACTCQRPVWYSDERHNTIEKQNNATTTQLNVRRSLQN